MRIGSHHDVRHGADAAFYLLARVLARGAARVGVLLAADLVSIGAAVAVVRLLVAVSVLAPAQAGAPIAVLFAYTAVLALAAAGTYRAGDRRSDPRRIACAVFIGGIALSVLVPLAGWSVAWAHLNVLACGAVVMILEGRLLAERLLVLLGPRGPRRVVLIDAGGGGGSGVGARDLVCGRLGVDPGDGGPDGHSGALGKILERERVDAVVVARPVPPDVMDALVETAFRRGTPVEAWLAPAGGVRHRAVVREEGGRLVAVCRPTRPVVPQMALKRALDVTIAGVALLLASPLFALIAAAIRLNSAGPVFFGQVRVGVGGRPFRMWKFRTMVPDAEALKPALAAMNETGDARLFKITYDPRVTRVGRWLRRTSLDELPQLINVLRGEMSLVGPRPFFPEDLALYEAHHMERLTVLPGITGLWQISGRSEIQDFETVVSLDREYIRRWSLVLDLQILAKTIPVVLRRDGAA